MGVMISGTYYAEDPGPDTTLDGEFKRAKSTIRDWISKDGDFAPTPGRYHLYAAWNCPWAHRALLTRVLLGLQTTISVSYARPRRTADGWVFDESGEFADPVLGVEALHKVYAQQRPVYTGRVTVPVLWDRETKQIVSNESADIVRMLGAFGGQDISPALHIEEIDRWNDLIYRTVNNGVYRAGFARTQEAYEAGVRDVFETLDLLEGHLESRDWIVGDSMTEVDVRLFPTLARFDVAYHYAFKCNIRRLRDYPNLWAYARRIYHLPGVADTVRLDIYKQGYFSPSELRNPLGIVPAGPDIDWSL